MHFFTATGWQHRHSLPHAWLCRRWSSLAQTFLKAAGLDLNQISDLHPGSVVEKLVAHVRVYDSGDQVHKLMSCLKDIVRTVRGAQTQEVSAILPSCCSKRIAKAKNLQDKSFSRNR